MHIVISPIVIQLLSNNPCMIISIQATLSFFIPSNFSNSPCYFNNPCMIISIQATLSNSYFPAPGLRGLDQSSALHAAAWAAPPISLSLYVSLSLYI